MPVRTSHGWTGNISLGVIAPACGGIADHNQTIQWSLPRSLLSLCILLALVGCFARNCLGQKKPVTIDTLVSPPPHPLGSANVVWSPDGNRLAAIEQGAVWIYDIDSRRRKRVLSLEEAEKKAVRGRPAKAFEWENRNVQEEPLAWSADGRQLLLSVGNDLFLFQLESGALIQLTATAEAERDAKLSPDGRVVAFRRDHDLYALEIASRKLLRLTRDGSATLLNGETDWVYPEELELGTAWWWSPDSKQIAYLQFDVSREPLFPQVDLSPALALLEPQRFPQPGTPNADVRLGVVSGYGGPTRWMDLGETRDYLLARVNWSPDSGQLAVERLNRIQNRLELKLADAGSGSVQVLLKEEDPFWINVNDDFRFLDHGRRLLWGSERDGHHHLYVYSSEGRLIRQLTRGEWDVSEVAGVDETSSTVYFTSTEASPLERQLFRIGLDGTGKQRISAEAGTHSISMAPGCRYYLDGFSSLTEPFRRILRDRNGRQLGVYLEARPEEHEILPAEIVRVKAADGALLYARLIRPAGFMPDRKYPAIVMIYGGPGIQTVRNSWSGPNFDQLLAQRGFVIWQLDNRGSAGRGHSWESRIFRNLGAQELEDQQAGIQYLLSLGFVDRARLGIHGWSYGGFMTLYSLCNAPDLFRAGIAGAPVTDMRSYDTIYTERYMGLPEDNSENYKRSSVVEQAEKLKAKLLLVHNAEDDNVHFQHTLRMAAALARAGKPYSLVIYPQKTHHVSSPYARHLYDTMADFFVTALGTQPTGKDH